MLKEFPVPLTRFPACHIGKVHELSPLWLSRNVSVVSQEPTLFGRSIKRNIKFGLEGTEIEPTDDEVKEAARLANAASFIEVSSVDAVAAVDRARSAHMSLNVKGDATWI